MFQANGGKDLVLSNGLLTRRFRISPNLAAVDYRNLSTNIRQGEGKAKAYRLNRNYEVEIPVDIEPDRYDWWVIE